MKDPVVNGRELARWVKEGLHKQGDGYLAGIYFMVSFNARDVNEGIDLVQWSLQQAITLGGCGKHIIPNEDEARKQVQTLYKHASRLSQALHRIGNIILSKDLRGYKMLMALNQVFLEELTTIEITESATKFRQLEKEAMILANYFCIGLGTLRHALNLHN